MRLEGWAATERAAMVRDAALPLLTMRAEQVDLAHAQTHRHGQRQDAEALPLCAVGAGRAQFRSRVQAAADAAADARARRVRRQVHDRLPQGISRRAGSRARSSRRSGATARSTSSASTPASRCRSGARRAGSIPTTRAAGSSGIAATTWAAACRTRIARQIKRWKAIRRHVRQVEQQLRAGRPDLPQAPAPGAAALGL